MLKRILPMVAILATTCILAVPSTASAWNRCGGQVSNWSQLYNNWKKQGILGSPNLKKVLVPAGYRPVDGSIKQFMRDRVMIGRTRTTVTIDNFGCAGGQLGSVGGKSLTAFWPIAYALPAKYSKKDVSKTPRKGYKPVRIRAHLVAQATCSNPGKKVITVTIYVKVSKTPKKPKKKPTPNPAPPAAPAPGCNQNGGTNTNSSTQCPTSDNNNDVHNSCPQTQTTNSTSCPTTINNYTYQYSCVSLTQNENGTIETVYYDSNGNVVQDKTVCSSITVVNPPPCENQSCNPPPTDHAPQISCVLLAHLYNPRGTAQLFCKARDADGDLIDPDIVATGAAHASGTLPSSMYGMEACPTGWTCYTTRIDADYVGYVTITATAIANGVPSIPWLGIYKVEEDDFGIIT